MVRAFEELSSTLPKKEVSAFSMLSLFSASCTIVPTQAPDNVRITRSGTTLTVSWSPLSLEAARGFPMYMVQYFPSTNLNQIVTLNTTGTSVTISNVNARISYGVKVAAFTKGGIGSLSKTAYEGGENKNVVN